MNLTSILNEIETLRPATEVETLGGNPLTQAGRVGVKRQAVERTKQLRDEYKNALKSSGIFIVVTGKDRDAFCAEVPQFGCFAADADQLYRDLISSINPTLFGKERTQYLFGSVADALYEKAIVLGITSYNHLQFNQNYSAYVNSAEELLPIIRAAVNQQVGSELVGIYTLHNILDQAIAAKHDNPVTPIVLNVPDETFALQLLRDLPRLNSKVFAVAAGKASRAFLTEGAVAVKNVSKDSVESALDSIRSKISI